MKIAQKAGKKPDLLQSLVALFNPLVREDARGLKKARRWLFLATGASLVSEIFVLSMYHTNE